MRLVVEFEGVIGVGEVLFRQLFVFPVGFDPVKKLCAFLRVTSLGGLKSLECFVMPCSLCGRVVAAGQIFRKVVAASESRGVEYSATDHHRNAGHFIDKFIFQTELGIIFLSSRYCFSAMLAAITAVNLT